MEELGMLPSIVPWATPGQAPFAAPVFLFDAPELAGDLSNARLVLRRGGGERVKTLLDQGAAQVLIGEAALKDAGNVERLAQRFGSGRIGVYVPAKRLVVNWSMDTQSNADFFVMRPSSCEPAWEALLADGGHTGTLISWWLGEMVRLGASSALVAVDIEDDQDLNICAGLVEQLGDRLWLTPLTAVRPALTDWVRWGKARQLAVADRLYREDPTVLAWRGIGDRQQEVA